MNGQQFNWDTGEWDPIERRCGRDDDHKAHTWRADRGGWLSLTLMCPGMPTMEPRTFTEYQAICVECILFQPIPFGNRDDRERWWINHQERSGHRIVFMMRVTRELEEIRRPAKDTEGDSHGGTDG
jgi:hypothetical protein